ncbi:MAG: glycosyltransferase family 39 protein [Chloroflexi bacterium]|nr:glycosyltransferase family 39 protein [Chloroflexota bacterium]
MDSERGGTAAWSSPISIPAISNVWGARVLLIGATLAIVAAVAYGPRGEGGVGGALYKLACLVVASGLVLSRQASLTLPAPAHRVWLPLPALLGAALALHVTALALLDRGPMAAVVVLWLVALALLPIAFIARPRPPRVRISRAGWLEVAGVVTLVAAGAVLRVYALGSYPSGIHGDEAELGLIAMTTLAGRGPNPFGLMFLGDPALFAYIDAVGIALFGRSIEAVRAVAALFGVLALPVFYFVARQMFGVRAGLIALAILSTNYTLVHFSRFALNFSEMIVLATLSFGCLWLGITRGQAVWYALAGVLGGLSMYFNFSTRLIPFVFAALFLYVFVTQPGPRRSLWRGLVTTALGGLIALGPAILILGRNPGQLMQHGQARFIFSDPAYANAVYQTQDRWVILWGQIQKNWLVLLNPLPGAMFLPGGGDAAFVAPIAWLVVVAVVYALVRWRQPALGFVLIWLVGFAPAGVLSIDAPQVHRIVLCLVAAGLLAGAVADRLLAAAPLALGASGRLVAAAGLVALLALTAVNDVQAYFVRSASTYPWQDTTLMARFISQQPPDTDVIVAGAPAVFASHGTTRFLAGEGSARDMKNLPLDLRSLQGSTQPIVFMVNGAEREWLSPIKAYYPGGVTEGLTDPKGDTHFMVYRLPASEAPRKAAVDVDRGLQVVVGLDGNPRRERTAVAPVLAYRDLATVFGSRFSLVARGDLIASPGDYALEVQSSGPAQLSVDGRQVISVGQPASRGNRATVRLVERQSIELRFSQINRPGTLELYWRPAGGQRTLIPPGALQSPSGG